MNTLLSAQAREDAKMTRDAASDRRARTRHMIQLGGLLKLSGLCQLCDIEDREDLQYDMAARDKAAMVLGILLEALANNEERSDPDQRESWRSSGERLLKQRAAQIAYQKQRTRR